MADYPFLKGHGTENDFVLLPDHDGTVTADLPGAGACAVRPAGRHRRRRRDPGHPDAPRSARAPTAEWFMDYRNCRRLGLARCAATGSGSSAATSPTTGLVDAVCPVPVGTRDGVKTLTVEDDGTDHRRHGRPRLLGETQGRRRRPRRGRPRTSTWATRTRSPSSTTSTTPGRCSTQPTHDAGGLPRRRQRRVRRTPRRAARRDAGARARLGRDPLLRHRRLRGDGGRAPSADGAGGPPPRTWPTGSTSRAARSPSPGPRTDRVLLTGPAVIVARGTTAL